MVGTLMNKTITSRDEVILAALSLKNRGLVEFTEWDLTVETWNLNKQRWGLPGYRDVYPDHKRVMNEVMAKGDKRLLTLGLIERIKTNCYKLTDAGIIYAENIVGDKDSRERASYNLYDKLEKYLNHNAFLQFQQNHDKPSLWLHASSFYGLSATMSVQQATARINEFENIINQAEETLKNMGEESIRRTTTGNHVTNKELEEIKEFHKMMRNRFKSQFDALLIEK
jgi:hypothetical protein